MKITYIICLLFLFIFSCNSSKREPNDLSTLEIDLSNSNSSSNIFYEKNEIFELIPLKYSGNESLIQQMRDLIILKDRFLVVDSDISNNKSLKLFDKQGNFLKSLNEINHDYVNHSIEFVTQFGEDSIIVVDKKSVLFYLDKDLVVLSEYQLPFKAEKLIIANKSFYFHTNKRALNNQSDSLLYNFIVTDYNFNQISKFELFKIEAYSQNVSLDVDSNFVPFDSGVTFAPILSDTIFRITENGKNPYVIIRFPTKIFDPKLFPDVSLSSILPILQSDFSWGIGNIIDNKEILYFTFFEKNNMKGVLYDKLNKITHVLSTSDLKSNPNVLPWPNVYHDGKYYGWYSEESASWFEIGDNKNYEMSILGKINNHINENSNPVIVSYSLKL